MQPFDLLLLFCPISAMKILTLTAIIDNKLGMRNVSLCASVKEIQIFVCSWARIPSEHGTVYLVNVTFIFAVTSLSNLLIDTWLITIGVKGHSLTNQWTGFSFCSPVK